GESAVAERPDSGDVQQGVQWVLVDFTPTTMIQVGDVGTDASKSRLDDLLRDLAAGAQGVILVLDVVDDRLARLHEPWHELLAEVDNVATEVLEESPQAVVL